MWRRLISSPDWRFFAAYLALVLLLQLIGPDTLRYERDWASSREPWRLLSAHWVHSGWEHLLLNTLGLAICISLTKPRWPLWRWLAQCLVMALGISLLFIWLNPELRWYVGFSGVLFGLYFLAAVDLYARDRLVALLIGAAIIVKVLLEQFTSLDINAANLIGTPVIVDAHFYGLLISIAIALVSLAVTMNHRST